MRGERLGADQIDPPSRPVPVIGTSLSVTLMHSESHIYVPAPGWIASRFVRAHT
jgi:hypothetical protein